MITRRVADGDTAEVFETAEGILDEVLATVSGPCLIGWLVSGCVAPE